MEATEIAIIIGALVAGIVTVIGLFFKQMNKSDERNAHAMNTLSCALANNTKSNERIALETKRSSDEARERNGHLAELVIANRVLIGKMIEVEKKTKSK